MFRKYKSKTNYTRFAEFTGKEEDINFLKEKMGIYLIEDRRIDDDSIEFSILRYYGRKKINKGDFIQKINKNTYSVYTKEELDKRYELVKTKSNEKSKTIFKRYKSKIDYLNAVKFTGTKENIDFLKKEMKENLIEDKRPDKNSIEFSVKNFDYKEKLYKSDYIVKKSEDYYTISVEKYIKNYYTLVKSKKTKTWKLTKKIL